ncbi:MAG: EAL domain-containing protein, partial [archaeon]
QVNKNINALLKSGITFTLDNFGKEHSSIAQLKQYHIKNIKLVKDLLQKQTLDYQDELIKLYRMITKEMDITLTAKGVIDQSIRKYIDLFDFDYAQGHYFTKPITFKELIEKTHE